MQSIHTFVVISTMSSEEVDDKNAVTGGDGGEAPATDGAGGGGGSETITLNVRDQVGCRRSGYV